MNMSVKITVLLLTAYTCFCLEDAEIETVDDVTTIYNLLGEEENELPVEIHSRTNALGMDPLTQFGYLVPENRDDDLQCLNRIAWGGKKCNWSVNGFNWEPNEEDYLGDFMYRGIPKYSFKSEILVKLCEDLRSDSYKKPYRSYDYYGSRSYNNDGYALRSSSSDNDKKCIMEVGQIINMSNYYEIQAISRCGTCGAKVQVDILDGSSKFGSKRQSIETFNVPTGSYLWIEMIDNNLKLWEGKDKIRLKTEHVDPNIDSTLNRISFNFDSQLSAPKIYSSQVLLAHGMKASLTSPQVVFGEGELCLVVLFHTSDSEHQEQLSASAVDPLENQFFLGSFHSNKSGWHIWKLEKTLPKHLKGEFLNIVIETLTMETIKIQRISSCGVEGKEEVSLITSDIKKTNVRRMGLTPYTVKYLPKISVPTELMSVPCRNGGVMTSAGCACVAGFTGPNCTQACGKNRYGQDCGGKCSIYRNECEGLLLCTPGADCHCAPGYHGPRCDQLCGSGTFGANCSQSCGQCLNEDNKRVPVCDIYTGICEDCQPGFFPPHCTDKYVHFIKAPSVLSDEYNTISVTITFTKDLMEGSGQPTLYQLQYRGKDEASGMFLSSWEGYSKKHVPQDKATEVVLMDYLKDGAEYQVRVVLIADDYNSYEEDDIPTAQVYTKCNVPDTPNYNVTSSIIKRNNGNENLNIFWIPLAQKHWCPVVEYEVWWKEGWQWKMETVTEELTNSYILYNILPDQSVKVKVRARTVTGLAPFSETISVTTAHEPEIVRNLKAVSVQKSSADISWSPPINANNNENVEYQISYECVKFVSCESQCVSEGSLVVNNTSITLRPLLPAAQYKVTVSAESSPPVNIILGTLESAPTEVPAASDNQPITTNVSASVFWLPAEICTGFLEAYHYELYSVEDIDSSAVLDVGETTKTFATFYNLQAATDYVVRVSLVTSGGSDTRNHLAIEVTTTATVPEEVRNLTVYKRGRNMVGLRWAEPRVLYGALESFTVTHSLGGEEKSVTVPPTPCVPWPHLYCHTVSGLKPARSYNFTVKARNKEIQSDGAGVFVSAQTKESNPGAPENLTVVNVTSTSLGLQWEHPSLANGVLRSFLVSVEETERHDQDQCCQVYPVIEITATEHRYYNVEVLGLHPASMYTVSVAGKTVGFGPSLTQTAATRPPAIPLTPTTISVANSSEWAWLPQTNLPQPSNSLLYASLIRSHILLVLTNSSGMDSGIQEPRLQTLLNEKIFTPFYFALEYNQGDGVAVGVGEEGDCQWGHFSNPPLELGQTYQLAALQISEYNKVLNVDMVFSTHFISNQI